MRSVMKPVTQKLRIVAAAAQQAAAALPQCARQMLCISQTCNSKLLNMSVALRH